MLLSRSRRPVRPLLLVGFVLFLLLLPAGAVLSQPTSPAEPAQAADWRSDWGLAPGFALDIDSEGFSFPSAMAFVPEPGPNPQDPLYYVVELRGTIKVVTNDRTVHTFATNPYPFVPREELPGGQGQGGSSGICLDPERGYLFLTYLYQDDGGLLRNGMLRYETTPGTFAIAPTAQRVLTPVFEAEGAGLAHFIGSCLVQDDLLYVGVGESWQPHKAQDLDSVIGKILRMTLDGAPVPDNPFYEDDDQTRPRNYIYAYGLRNPWGLRFVGDRLFAADNGAGIDRFVEIEPGRNYFWNGRDSSIATNASYVWTPAVGPTQMTYADPGQTLLPEGFRDQFFIGTSAGGITDAAIFSLRFDFAANRLAAPPAFFLRWLHSDSYQAVMGTGFGPDGLYFTPLYPGPDGSSPVLKISYDPARGHPFGTEQTGDPRRLFSDRGCIGCHRLDGRGGFGGGAGPALDRTTLAGTIEARVTSEVYLRSLDAIDQLTTEPQVAFRDEREALRNATGAEQVRLYLKYRILEPRWDNTTTQMPNVGLTEAEAASLADFLMEGAEATPSTPVEELTASVNRFFRSRLRVALAAFALGLVAAGGTVGLYGLVRRRRRGANAAE